MIVCMFQHEEVMRVRMPREGEVLGIAITMLGAGKISVECEDGYTRVCRIPGRLLKKVWIRVGDMVLVQPWKVQSNERGDIVWRYTRTETNWMRRRGYGKKLRFD